MRVLKYEVYESAGVLGLVPVRETAPRLLTFAIKPLGRRQLESVRVAATMLERVAAMHCARAWRAGSVLVSNERFDAKGRDHWGFISLSPSLATSVPEILCFLLFFVLRPEPAACA